MDLNALKKANDLPAAGLTEKKPGFKLPTIGNNPERPMERSQRELPKRGFERFKIYEHQQKPYDIIKNSPRGYESIRLRNWPKYSLEHRLREKGTYHSFEKEEF